MGKRRKSTLSVTEETMVRAMLRSEVVSYSALTTSIWGCCPNGGPIDPTNILRVMINRVRPLMRELGVEIFNVWGIGYHIDPKHKSAIESWIVASRIARAKGTRLQYEAQGSTA